MKYGFIGCGNMGGAVARTVFKGAGSGDMLLAVNGQAVTTTYDVSAVKDGLKVGDTITLTIYRDGKTFDVDVKLVDTNDIS